MQIDPHMQGIADVIVGIVVRELQSKKAQTAATPGPLGNRHQLEGDGNAESTKFRPQRRTAAL